MVSALACLLLLNLCLIIDAMPLNYGYGLRENFQLLLEYSDVVLVAPSIM